MYDWQQLSHRRPIDLEILILSIGLSIGQREQPDMVRSKPRVKKEKTPETTEEFVARVNSEARKRNGLKQNLKGARR